MKRKHIGFILFFVLSLDMVIVGICGMLIAWYLNAAELSDPIEIIVSSRNFNEHNALYLTASEFDSPQFYTKTEDDIGVIQENISDGDKISVRVYDYDRGAPSYFIAELQKDGEILYTHTSDGDGGRGAYIGFGIVIGIGVLLTVLCSVLFIKEKHKKNNLRDRNE